MLTRLNCSKTCARHRTKMRCSFSHSLGHRPYHSHSGHDNSARSRATTNFEWHGSTTYFRVSRWACRRRRCDHTLAKSIRNYGEFFMDHGHRSVCILTVYHQRSSTADHWVDKPTRRFLSHVAQCGERHLAAQSPGERRAKTVL